MVSIYLITNGVNISRILFIQDIDNWYWKTAHNGKWDAIDLSGNYVTTNTVFNLGPP